MEGDRRRWKASYGVCSHSPLSRRGAVRGEDPSKATCVRLLEVGEYGCCREGQSQPGATARGLYFLGDALAADAVMNPLPLQQLVEPGACTHALKSSLRPPSRLVWRIGCIATVPGLTQAGKVFGLYTDASLA
jgi:hypothetical protein